MMHRKVAPILIWFYFVLISFVVYWLKIVSRQNDERAHETKTPPLESLQLLTPGSQFISPEANFYRSRGYRRCSEQRRIGSGCVGNADSSEKQVESGGQVSFWPQIEPFFTPSKRATKRQKRVPRMPKARSLDPISARLNAACPKCGTCHILVNGEQ